MAPSIKLGEKRISSGSAPYIIAEIGVNHEGSLELAKKLIELAHEGGADAAKFQTYKAGRIASKNSPAYWDLSKEPTTSQHELFKKYDAFEEQDYILLAEHCKKVGIDFLSTPFDDDAVDFLDKLMPLYKIASADITSVPLLKKVAGKGKPVVLSTGASTKAEIHLAVKELLKAGAVEIALLHCILNYPTQFENAHLNMISDLRVEFPDYVIGYSDHTIPEESMLVLTMAYLKGAQIIEKHFTHDKTLPGNDHYHAMDVKDLKNFKKQLALAQTVSGMDKKQPLDNEEPARKFARRSLVLQRGIKKGEIISESHLTYKRPGIGISPMEWDQVIGLQAIRDLDEDTVLTWDDFEGQK